MQFIRGLRDRIRRGEITCSVRLWQRAHVKVGGRYSLPPGHILVTAVSEISLEDITPDLARQSGFVGVVDLLKTAKHGSGRRVFLVEFRYEKAPPAQEGRMTRSSTPWLGLALVLSAATAAAQGPGIAPLRLGTDSAVTASIQPRGSARLSLLTRHRAPRTPAALPECRMPVAVPDQSRAERMPGSFVPAVGSVGTERLGCSNPLGPGSSPNTSRP